MQVNCFFCFFLLNSSTSLSGGAQKVSQKLSGFSRTFDIVSDYFRNIITIQFRSTSLLHALSFSVLHSSWDCSLQRKPIGLFLLARAFFPLVQKTFTGCCHDETRNPKCLSYNNTQPGKNLWCTEDNKIYQKLIFSVQ